MIDNNNQIPKELEGNMFIKKLWENTLRLDRENKQLKDQLVQLTNSQSTSTNSDVQGERTEQIIGKEITTYREITQRDKEGYCLCNYCDRRISLQWRQQICLWTCDPNCASLLERIVFSGVDSYKKNIYNNSKKN